MKKSILITLILVLTCTAIPLFASSYYEKGNTFFSINAGVNYPAIVIQGGDKYTGAGIEGTKINLGGVGSLSYQACISSYFAIGGEIGYAFNYVIDGKLFTQVPLTAKATIMAVQTGKFDLNIHANLGGNFIKRINSRSLAPFASISLNPVVYFSDNWGLGINAGFAAGFEFAKDSKKNALFGEVPATLSLIYRR